MNESVEPLAAKIRRLEIQVEELKQANEDLEIAFTTAVEHGDAIESELYATNAKLNDEVRERTVAERRLEQLLKAVREQKSDLEAIVQTITEHSDEIDTQWLHRYEEIETQVNIDPLTGIANRRAFDQHLDREWRRCSRSQEPLGLIFSDLDYFKQYNDTYGHPQGDLALKQVSSILQSLCRRDSDLVARVGGEEFALLMPGQSEESLLNLAEKGMQLIRGRAIPHEGSPFGILTLSMGYITLIPDKDADPIEQFYTRADIALYKAKQAGRNQLCCNS